MSFEEFMRWELFDAETPIDDLHNLHLPAARVAALIANANRDTKKNPLPFEIKEFLPPWHDLCDGPAEPDPDLAAKLDQAVDLINL